MASCYTEPSILGACIQDEDEEEKEPISPQRISSDESEESEPEPALTSVVRRRVSFADTFGLDLVSVKEFDNGVESAKEGDGEDYQLSCIFTVPASNEELVLRLQQNKLELESIELLPGSTIIRGTVRVLNLSYHKVVYVHATLDGWQSHFDQLAEYIPGSSDGETDRFTFKLTLMPPFPPSGAKVEFCVCYESSIGHFWANNGGMNYVLFCHQRGGRALKEKEGGKERETEENNQKGKKSCLKAIKKGSCAESKPMDMSSELSEREPPRSVENMKGKSQHKAESRSRDTLEEGCKTLAERRKRRRAAQLAYLQDFFSHRETEVRLVQPSHQEISNALLPMPKNSIPLMRDTLSALNVCSRKEQNGNTSLILPYWGRNISSPSPYHTNSSEIISGIRPDDLETEQTEDVSRELSNDAWKGTDSLENHNNALGLLEFDPTKLSQALDPCPISEVLRYKCPEKAQITSEPYIIQKPESVWVQWRADATEAPHDKHTLRERPFSEDEPMLITKPGETAYSEDAIKPPNSKRLHRVLLEENSTGFLDTEAKVKGHTHRVVKDTFTFTRIRNKPYTDSRESLERQHVDESGELKKKKEHIREENENAFQMKMTSWSKYSGEDLVALEGRLQEDDEKQSHLKDGITEVWISSRTSVVCDEGESHKQTECLNRGEEEAVCFELVKKGLSDFSERQVEEISSVKYIADGERESGLKAEDQGVYGRWNQGDKYKELHKDLHKLQSSPETCPNLCINSHISSPSGHFSWTESVSESKLLFKDFENEESLRNRVVQNLQDQGVGTEFPSSFSRMASPSVGTRSSWLLECWAKISILSYITGALVCVILFLIFITAYLHDLPLCLAIYLLSACWWCRQGMKKHVTTSESVD